MSNQETLLLNGDQQLEAASNNNNNTLNSLQLTHRESRHICVRFFLNLETWSVIIPTLLGIIGYFLSVVYLQHDAGRFLVSAGVFGTAGALANIATTRLLFVRIPNLYGSGSNATLIERHHRELRATVREVVMTVFFERKYIEEYFHQRTQRMASNLALESTVRQFLESEEVNEVIERKLMLLARRPELLYLSMVGLPLSSLKSWARLVALSMSTELTPLIEIAIRPAMSHTVASLYEELEQLVSSKLTSLTPSDITKIVKPVMAPHLSWFAVCGAGFGCAVGILTELVRLDEFLHSSK